jgi:protein tyrosine/serine phosphatase
MTGFSRLQRCRFLVAMLTAGLLLSPAVALGGWALGIQLSGNVHEVEPSQLYRSGQLSGSFLNEVIDRYDIRTVINLRGRHPGTEWYRDEMAIATRKGVTHIDIRMSANKEPDAATIGRLIEAFKTAPRPILIHCEAGADRSGLASAIYELLIAHRSASEAGRQLSFFYGHFPWLTSKTGAMDNAFDRIEASVR